MITINRLGHVQRDALSMYVFDPCHLDWVDEFPEDAFPGSFDGSVLTVTDRGKAVGMLIDAANSADEDNDPEFRDALQAVARRVARAGDD